MQILFIIIFTFGLAYYLFKKRIFDFFTLSYISAGIYFLPGFFGYSLSPYNQAEIVLVDKTYIIMIAVLLSILISGIINDALHKKDNNVDNKGFLFRDYGIFLKIIIGVSLISFALMLLTSGELLFHPQKSKVMDSLNRFHILWAISTSLWVVLSFVKKKNYLFFIGLIFLLFDVFIGFRSTTAITIMAVVTIHLHNKGPQVLAKKWKTFGLGTMLALFFFVYKKIYAYIKLGRWDLVKEKLTDYSFYVESITLSEPFTTQTVLNSIVDNNFHVGIKHFSSIIYQFIPINIFSPSNPITFNDMFQSTLFPGIGFGMAGNIWGQMYSSGGWLLLILFLLLFNLVIYFGNYLIKVQDSKLLSTMSLIMVYWSFYIHRNSLQYELNLIKRVFLTYIIIFLISLLIVGSIKKSKKIITFERKNNLMDY